MVTGGCGFIGSNFIQIALEKIDNVEILNIDKLSYAGNLENLESINDFDNYQFLRGDICDLNFLIDAFDNFKPSKILHFAAESHVDKSIEGPIDFIHTNVLGTANLLHASYLHFNQKYPNDFQFFHVSTDEVYGSLEKNDLFTEKTPYDPKSPYSASKAGSDHLVRAWRNTYNINSIITNCSNNYGPFQYPEKLIPLTITKCLANEKIPIYGNGLNIRDWLHVYDHCDALLTIINNGGNGETYNIGGDNQHTNISIVNLICELLDRLSPSKLLDSYKELIHFTKDRPGHDFRYAIDSSKLKEELGWSSKIDFEEGLLKTVEWYLNNEAWWKKLIP